MYEECIALKKGYAQSIPFVNGIVTICEAEYCPEGNRRKVHIDGEPKRICLKDGLLEKKSQVIISDRSKTD